MRESARSSKAIVRTTLTAGESWLLLLAQPQSQSAEQVEATAGHWCGRKQGCFWGVTQSLSTEAARNQTRQTNAHWWWRPMGGPHIWTWVLGDHISAWTGLLALSGHLLSYLLHTQWEMHRDKCKALFETLNYTYKTSLPCSLGAWGQLKFFCKTSLPWEMFWKIAKGFQKLFNVELLKKNCNLSKGNLSKHSSLFWVLSDLYKGWVVMVVSGKGFIMESIKCVLPKGLLKSMPGRYQDWGSLQNGFLSQREWV